MPRRSLITLATVAAFLVPAGIAEARYEPAGPVSRAAAVAAAPKARPCRGAKPVARYHHVVWIWFENHGRDAVIGSPDAPYINAVARACGLANRYDAITHPSLPNYIAATSGGTQGIVNDDPPSANATRAVSIFELAGSWKSYQEAMPRPCALKSSGRYAVRHDPAAYYLRLRSRLCARDVPLGTPAAGALASDLRHNRLPRFSFVTPDLCNDMHDCGVATGDAWLRRWLPVLLASRAYRGGYTAIFITWDEAEGGGANRVATIAIAPSVRRGSTTGAAFNHYSLLRTTESMLRLRPLLGSAAHASSMRSPAAPVTGRRLPVRGVLLAALVAAAWLPAAPAGAAPRPITAAFYYAWYPETWRPAPHAVPALGHYRSTDRSLIRAHLKLLHEAHVDAAIVSWWGRSDASDGRFRRLMRTAGLLRSPVRFAIYHEGEGQGDPPVASLAADIAHVLSLARSPRYLRVGGKPVIFAFADGGDACGMAARWRHAARGRVYVVLKVFPGYQSCADQPSAWHQYAPDRPLVVVPGQSVSISPGFFKAGEARPRLARDIRRFRASVRAMNAARVRWHLITTFNEWGEGTAVEPATSWRRGYIGALARRGQESLGVASLTAVAGDGSALVTAGVGTGPRAAGVRAHRVGRDERLRPRRRLAPGPPRPRAAAAALPRRRPRGGLARPRPGRRPERLDPEGLGRSRRRPAGAARRRRRRRGLRNGFGRGRLQPGADRRAGDGRRLRRRPRARRPAVRERRAHRLPAFYDASWGAFKSTTHPAPGNHEYNTPDAAGYFGYFGKRAGDAAKGYYSFRIGAWHLIALNSNCAGVGGCGPGSPQETWLRADLAAHRGVLHARLLASPAVLERRPRRPGPRRSALAGAGRRGRRRRARRPRPRLRAIRRRRWHPLVRRRHRRPQPDPVQGNARAALRGPVAAVRRPRPGAA